MPTTRRTLMAASAAVATGALLAAPRAAAASPRQPARPKPTIVLVHGAFADASGWNDVAGILRRDGYHLLAPANPLRGVSADSAYLASILATLSGPLVLVRTRTAGWPSPTPRPATPT
jgi:pimeloyl-ACP methyl ester carboxylesterase